jgi:hypothetical protein
MKEPDQSGGNLKSAFELAMERMAAKDGAIVHLSDEQKEQIAEIGRRTTAKIAELEILHARKLAEATAANDEKKVQQLQEEFTREVARLRARENEDKARIRQAP